MMQREFYGRQPAQRDQPVNQRPGSGKFVQRDEMPDSQ